MPTDVQVIFQGPSLLPKDRYINTLYFDGDFGIGQMDELWGKYNTFASSQMGPLASGTVHEIRAYDPGPNPGGPRHSKKYALTNPAGDGGPGEVALCLSYASVDNPEASTPRRRGRVYLGPFSSGKVGYVRPQAALIAAALTLGEGIAQVGFAANTTWMLRSSIDGSYHKVESIWCDDSWDTQRRRGLEPTAKTVRDVQ